MLTIDGNDLDDEKVSDEIWYPALFPRASLKTVRKSYIFLTGER